MLGGFLVLNRASGGWYFVLLHGLPRFVHVKILHCAETFEDLLRVWHDRLIISCIDVMVNV